MSGRERGIAPRRSATPPWRLLLLLAAPVAGPLFLERAAQPAGPAATLTPDQRTLLLSREVGGLRWLMIDDLAHGTVSANVYDPSGGPTRFLSCRATDQLGADLVYDCSSATDCATDDCAATWNAIDSFVSVPLSFFRAGTFTASLDTLVGSWNWKLDDSNFYGPGLGGTTFSDKVLRHGELQLHGIASAGEVFVREIGDGINGFQFELLDENPPILALECILYRFNQIGPGALAGLIYMTPINGMGQCQTEDVFPGGVGFAAQRTGD
jgi:hypothetical protein